MPRVYLANKLVGGCICSIFLIFSGLWGCSNSTKVTTPVGGGTTGGGTTGGGTTDGGTTDGGTTDSTTDSTTGGSSTGTSVSSALSGQVSSFIVASSQSQKFSLIQANPNINACGSVAYGIHVVGGDGSAVVSGTTDPNGLFASNWQSKVASPNDTLPEVAIKFACPTAATSTLTCYAKSQNANLVCDPVDNAIAISLQKIIGSDPARDPNLQGLSIASMVQGLAATLRLAAVLNPTADYSTQLANATDPNQMSTIINASPVGALFASLQAVVNQTIVNNTIAMGASGNPNTQQQASLQSVWSAQQVIQMLVGLGLNVRIGLDDQDSEPSIYGTWGTLIDAVLANTFSEDVQNYLSDLYQDIYVNQDTASTVGLFCQAQIKSQATAVVPPIVYAPDVFSSNPNFLQLTCLGPTAQKIGIADTSHNPNSSYNVAAVVSSTFTEADRNDPDGTYQNPQALSMDIRLIDVFRELKNAMNPNGICASSVEGFDSQSGPGQNSNFMALAACIKANHMDKYFAGVVGIDQFLTDPNLMNARMSLVDIHHALVDYLGLRLYVNNFSNSGLLNLSVVDAAQGSQQTVLPPNFLFDSGNANMSNKHEVLYVACPDIWCSNGLPNNANSINIHLSDVNNLLHDSAPTFAALMQDFVAMPDLSTFNKNIFSAAHYVGYNITGTAYYSMVGYSGTGDFNTNRPIACQILDPNGQQNQQFRPGYSIDCVIPTSSWLASNSSNPNAGNQFDTNYLGWYGLSPRNVADDGNTYFALVDFQFNQELTLNNQVFRVRDISGVASPLDGNGQTVVPDSNTIYKSQASYCATQTNSFGASQSNCQENTFYYVAKNFPNQNANTNLNPNASYYPLATSNYQPYSWPLPITVRNSGTGQSAPQTVSIARTTGSTQANVEPSQTYAVCITSAGVVVDPNTHAVVTSLALNASTVVNCQNILSAGTSLSSPNTSLSNPNINVFYYLALNYSTSYANASSYEYNLLRNDGLIMRGMPNSCPNPPTNQAVMAGSNTVSSPCPAQVSLTAVQAALGGKLLGPTSAPKHAVALFNVSNPRYNPLYDPFCLDTNHDNMCDCTRDGNQLTASTTPSAADCNLGDAPGQEPTVSMYPTALGTQAADTLQKIMDDCGNQDGNNLVVCLVNKQHTQDLPSIPADWTGVFACSVPSGNPNLTSVNIANVLNNPNHAGVNCGNSNDAALSGPVMLRKYVKRNNAYDINKPQTALRLLSQATQSIGTGTTLDPNQPYLNFGQALSLAFLRVALPVKDIDIAASTSGQAADPNQFYATPPYVLSAQSMQLNIPGQPNLDIANALLRVFLLKANELTP